MLTTSPLFLEIDNEPRAYAWGQIDGVALVRGTAPHGGREAELWLGAHPSAPSTIVSESPWQTLNDWERAQGAPLPFLLKILCAAEPLSLQAHPSTQQAREGFAREDALGIPRDAPHRNYRDPYAKPEMIVALHDGFQALCGFRAVEDVLQDLRALGTHLEAHLDAAAPSAAALATWRALLTGAGGIRRAFLWLLSDDPALPALIDATTTVAAHDSRFAVLDRICAAHPNDPGILGALMLQHHTLRTGEALWLPAGNIHAYLHGSGIELMGPSDNVMRGGLTGKHIDTAELDRVLDAREGGDPRLAPVEPADGVRVFRPGSGAGEESPGFELHMIDGAGETSLGGPAIALATEGEFELASGAERIPLPRGRAVLISRPATVRVEGEGRLFIAAGR